MPVPFWFTTPEPLMTPESVCTFAPVLMPFTEPLSVTLFAKVSPFTRLIASVAPRLTAGAVRMFSAAPAVTPSPICSVPAVTVVAPL